MESTRAVHVRFMFTEKYVALNIIFSIPSGGFEVKRNASTGM